MPLDFQPIQNDQPKIDFSPIKPAVPDTALIKKNVQDNLAAHKSTQNPENQELPSFSKDIDIGMGMPVSQVLGSDGKEVDGPPLPPHIREYLTNSYKDGTAVDAGDYMQNAIPAAAQVVGTGSTGYVATQALMRGALEGAVQTAQAKDPFKDRPQDVPAKDYVGKLLNQSFLDGGYKNSDWYVANILHGAAAMSPTLALGFAGTTFGAAAGEAVMPAGGGVPGGLAGGAAGFAAGGAMQTIAKSYQTARADGLSHDAAVNRAIKESTASGAISGLMGLAPGVKIFGTTTKQVGEEIIKSAKKPLSEALAQIFAVQPTIGATGQAVTAGIEQKPITPDSLLTGYVQNVGTGVAMVGTHAAGTSALQGIIGPKIGKPPEAVTQEDINQVISTAFKNQAPTAQEFKDHALVMFGHDGEAAGVETLHTIYKETGVTPTQVFEDAKNNPAVASDISSGKVPAAYDSFKESPDATPQEETPVTKQTVEEKPSVLTKLIPEQARDIVRDVKNEILSATVPMEVGSPRAQAAAKDFANNIREAQWLGTKAFNDLKNTYTPEQLTHMWNAMDEASVHAQTLEANGMTREEAVAQTEKDGVGHFKLPEDQQKIIKELSDQASEVFQQAKELGMVDGDGLPFWTPRMAAAIGKDGKWESPGSKEGRPSVNSAGGNLRTTSPSLKGRKYLTSEETEGAMKSLFGEEHDDVALVRDLRAMPLAIARLRQAVAGRALIDQIKTMSSQSGMEAVRDTPHDGYFTLDHPAFQTYKPKLEMGEDGKWRQLHDEHGLPIFEKTPIYVSKEFEGPLKAVLSNNSGEVYKGLMTLKGKALGLIMYSPMIHNAVEYGRALPAMPGKVLTFKVYFEGNKAKKDPAQMREAIQAGLVPIGSRFFNQDISSIMESPDLTPGRSWTAKLLGGLTGKVSKNGELAVKRAIDNLGDFWHNTLLWDRVGDLQMGLYVNLRDAEISKGTDPKAAQALAAHLANRFAGALPMESMGNAARKIANVSMFSRSFTIGNLGVMKDMFVGLPSDVKAQLTRDVGEVETKKASKAARRKAQAAFALDIALMYAGNSILQDFLDHVNRDKSLTDIEQGYIDRWQRLIKNHAESPWDLLNVPGDLQAISSTSSNEPGKEGRIHFSDDPKTGTSYYMRLPTGKIGEEFLGWMTSPLEMARKKASTLVGPALDIFRNSDYFGHPIYDKDARGFIGHEKMIGDIVTYFMKAQIPEDSVISTYNLLTGSKDKELDYMKTLGPLAGITFSKGYPGGPEAGILSATARRQEAEVVKSLPDIKSAVEDGDIRKAKKIMSDLNMVPREQNRLIKHYKDPGSKVNARNLATFKRTATEEEKQLMEDQE